jgi:flavin reductase (DIM6/NTAB) family NADH-FMN oxidoreductase RutF
MSPALQAMTDLEPARLTGVSTITEDQFKSAFRHHAAGVALISADPGTGPVALTATSVFSVSANPPVLVFSLSSRSSSAAAIRNSETVVVHILDAQQVDLAILGATSGIDRFADTSQWSRLVTNEPFFHAAHTWLRGRITDVVPAGDSHLVIVEALQAHITESAASRPLAYHNRTWHGLGDASRLNLEG